LFGSVADAQLASSPRHYPLMIKLFATCSYNYISDFPLHGKFL
jgi:hypothetical protein